MNIKKLQRDLETFFEKKGYKTSTAIAELLEMPQSTVHRSLYNKHAKLTKGIMKLCDYAHFDMAKYSEKDPASNRYLMEALNLVWNGTDAHAKQLSRLLMIAHSCKLSGTKSEA